MSNTAQSASALACFNFHTHSVRTITKNGEVWFVASDVADALEYRDASNIIRVLDDDEADTHIVSIRSENGVEQNREVAIINESGLYHAVLKSRKPLAKSFRKWVTSEVLPALRTTGDYSTSASSPNSVAATRLELAFALSTEIAAKVSRTVFNAVMNGDDTWHHTRWMFGLSYDHQSKTNIPWAKQIEPEAVVASLAKLADMIAEPGGMMPSNQTLAKLSAACAQRLSQRII